MRILQRTELFSFICSGRKTGNSKLLYEGRISSLGHCHDKISYFFLCLSRAFEDVQVFWRVTFNKGTPSVVNNGVNLTKELAQTSGSTVCKSGEVICALTLTALDDEVNKRPRCSKSTSFQI